MQGKRENMTIINPTCEKEAIPVSGWWAIGAT